MDGGEIQSLTLEMLDLSIARKHAYNCSPGTHRFVV
jgi:hypothetical protein